MSGIPEHLSDAHYERWCRAWLGLVGRYSQRLVDWMGRQPDKARPPWFPENFRQLDETLPGLVSRLSAPPPPDDASLVALYGCLRELETLHAADPERFDARPRHVDLSDGRYVLVPPIRMTMRPPLEQGGTFRIAHQYGTAGDLGLRYRWAPLQDGDVLDWKREQALEAVLYSDRLRLGLAPCATHAHMVWDIDPQAQPRLDGCVPVRCRGAKDPRALWQVIESVLSTARDQGVQVLVLPELIFDQDLLNQSRQWLRQHNFTEDPVIRMVIAGSHHCSEGEEFANRCTVLDQRGEDLWVQDKRSHFKIESPAVLEGLCPGCGAQRGFEPTVLGQTRVVRETAIGRLLTPICLDFIEDQFFDAFGADIFLVPAMSKGLGHFRVQAEGLGSRHGAASFICNARTEDDHRVVGYLPVTKQPVPAPAGHELFIWDLEIRV